MSIASFAPEVVIRKYQPLKNVNILVFLNENKQIFEITVLKLAYHL